MGEIVILWSRDSQVWMFVVRFGGGDYRRLDRDDSNPSEELWEVPRIRSEECSGLSEHQVRLGVTSDDLL